MLASSTQPQYGMSNIHTALCCWPKTVDAWPAVTSQRFCLEKQGFRGTPFKTEKPYSAFVSILMKAACPLINFGHLRGRLPGHLRDSGFQVSGLRSHVSLRDHVAGHPGHLSFACRRSSDLRTSVRISEISPVHRYVALAAQARHR